MRYDNEPPFERPVSRPWFDTLRASAGHCPNCGSADTIFIRRSEPETGCQCLTCCAGCLLYLPLLLIVPFLRRDYLARHCNHCGYEWPA